MREKPIATNEAPQESRILIVDDQPENGRLVTNILGRAGYHIQFAEDAAAGLALVERRPPDLILLDIMMPGMDGFEMCRRLKADPQTAAIPVVFLTGRDDSESLKAGFDAGGVDYITKPVDTNVLLSRVGSQIRILNQQRRLLEREFELARARRMETVGRLAGGVAHEFNNLLQVILGYAELLDEQMADAPGRDLIVPILESGARGKEIVRELLVYTDRNSSKRSEVDLSATIRDLGRILANLMTERIEFSLELDPAPTLADPSEIRQIMTNLCLNAKDAILPEPGTVSIRTGTARFDHPLSVREATMPPGEYAYLAVADTGRGIDPEILNKILEPFFSTREVGEGIGLGLPVVWGIMRRHDGYIDIHSTVGKGTDVVCYFPLCRHASPESFEGESRQGAESAPHRRVVVCEDDPLVRGFTVDLFRSLGYDVDVASDGYELIELVSVNAQRYDLIYTDIAMPRMSGPEAVRKVRHSQPWLPPVLFATGHGDSDIQTHLNGAREELILRKPFTRRELEEAVQSIFAGLHPEPVS